MKLRVAVYVRMYKNAQMAMCLTQNRVSVCAKEAFLKMSGMNELVSAAETTTKFLAYSHVDASVLSTYNVEGIGLLIQRLAGVCAHHLLAPARRS